jgi:hypothetical protein
VALASAREDSWLRTQRICSIGLARVALGENDRDEALSIADRVEADVVRSPYVLNARADGLVECAVIAALSGDTETAHRRGLAALETATAKGNAALARKARALLKGDLSAL